MSALDKGKVYLVGAGPGDAGLITVRGMQCLQRADVVVYDNLANHELLCHAPPTAERVYAGKKASQHHKTQDEIHDILLERARAGKMVVRLKGGDPFLFGRGGEEAEWLTQHGIAWEVVPGVTSAIAVPAYAGIPVTHRSVNGSLHTVTGHENQEGLGADIDWQVFAKSRGTIVLLMGVKNLGRISEELQSHGMSPQTPVAIVEWGTRARQRTVVSTLENIAADAAAAGIKPPATTIIGEVVRLRESLAWVEKRPLFGWRVAVTRPMDQNASLASALEDLGAEALITPTLKLVELDGDSEAAAEMAKLAAGDYDWLVFTSANGVRAFARLWMKAGHDARSLSGCKVAVIGTRTGDAARRWGIKPDITATDSTQEGIAEMLMAEKARRVLIARAKEARPVLRELLLESGAEVSVLPVYETVPDEEGIARLKELLEAGRVDAVTFTSAKTFQVLAEAGGAQIVNLLNQCTVGVIGPITREAVENGGVKVAAMALDADVVALAQALAEHRP